MFKSPPDLRGSITFRKKRIFNEIPEKPLGVTTV